ncbi:MAG: PAS domain-containing protein, partial [Syntrophales bacterium]|nr:PAS domain-containing protein [Syntrophales bacterium]
MGNVKDKRLRSEAELRRRAEERLRAKTVELPPSHTDEESRRLVHELEVHQIELEMQNAELRRTQEELELSRNKYTELYDFAPVGYFTFDKHGLIREVNHAGAKLMGTEKRLLINRPFIGFIADADEKDIFLKHIESVLVERSGMHTCEISLTGKCGAVISGQLQSVAIDSIENKDGYILSSIIDGTLSKQLSEALQ